MPRKEPRDLRGDRVRLRVPEELVVTALERAQQVRYEIAKVELDYPTMKFIDYFSLLKVGGTWVIVNKIFHRLPAVPSR